MDLLPSSWCARRCTFCSNWISDDYVTSGKGNLAVVLHVLRLRAWGVWLLHTGVAGCAFVAPRWDTLSVLSCWRLNTLRTPIPWDKAWVSGWERCTSLKVPGTGVGRGVGSGEPWGAPPPPPCHPMAVVGSAPPLCGQRGFIRWFFPFWWVNLFLNWLMWISLFNMVLERWGLLLILFTLMLVFVGK